MSAPSTGRSPRGGHDDHDDRGLAQRDGARPGRRTALPGITILHFEDGLCVERWVFADMLGLLV
ncbi:ester cyclase [Pseudonocardia kujensis]|uniref:ester cyclase n=1 Tax=Pseudonocardia kujensis TaxID=1128675 RepID=UPI001E4FE6B4|nr:ester cyclase [Pseudonocardia kujensis]MCE0766953.1 ester cyclase [Pseudonocardia kujensis]